MGYPDQNELEVQKVDSALAELVTRTEYDVQISTARRYPRSIKAFVNQAIGMATFDEEIANECIYAVPRDGKTIEGPSARFAEIIMHAWGHTRAGARVVNEDERFITAQGVCHDLQSNMLVAFEVPRRITRNNGSKFNDDMIGVTGNAASSIALRNAVLKTIPKAFWSKIYSAARAVVSGDSRSLANGRSDALAYLQKFGITKKMILNKLEVAGVEDITLDHLVTLRGIATALKEGDVTIEQIFADEAPPPSTAETVRSRLRDRAQPVANVAEDLAAQEAKTRNRRAPAPPAGHEPNTAGPASGRDEQGEPAKGGGPVF
jgi:hypothetical protein